MAMNISNKNRRIRLNPVQSTIMRIANKQAWVVTAAEAETKNKEDRAQLVVCVKAISPNLL